MRTVFTKQNDIYAITNFVNIFVVEIIIIMFNNVLSIYIIFDVTNALIITISKNVRTNITNTLFVKTNIKLSQIFVQNANINIKNFSKHKI